MCIRDRMYVEKLRDKYDVTIAEAPDFRGERHIYTLRSIDHEAEAAINAYSAFFARRRSCSANAAFSSSVSFTSL